MMGLTPREVDRLTLAEFRAMFDGFRQFHSGTSGDEVTADDYFAARARAEAAGRA